VAECLEIAVVTQGATLDEAVHNLKEAVELHLEGEDLAAMGLAPNPVVLITMEMEPEYA
jgi:predicted RNase H-like HicB family nuclease